MRDQLQQKIKILTELMWDRRIDWNDVERWLANFRDLGPGNVDERIHALYLLSSFSYFNTHLVREFAKAVFRDMVQYPILKDVRQTLANSIDLALVLRGANQRIRRLRFVGMGNPSESGTHLLYYFRQENRLPRQLFVNTHELFDAADPTKLSPNYEHLVFLDDLCGSGTQAASYSKKLLSRIASINSSIRFSYFPLFATTSALNLIRTSTAFHDVEALYELDDSFRSLSTESRYFRHPPQGVTRQDALTTCNHHGHAIEPGMPLGYRDGQLLLGFAHNIPDNTLPIFWSEGRAGNRWKPIFRRFPKEEM